MQYLSISTVDLLFRKCFIIVYYLLFQVIAEGEGELIVMRRPAVKTSSTRYIPCTKCFAFFHVDTLSSHIKRCPLREKGEINETNSKTEGLMMLTPYLPATSRLESDILLGMKETLENEGIFTYYRITVCFISKTCI